MERIAMRLAVFCLGLALLGCEPDGGPGEDSPDYEAWLQERGLTPLGQQEAGKLLTEVTLYGRYGGGKKRWIEHYSRSGVSVFQPDAAQSPKRRVVYFGTWWIEADRTCFSYPSRSLDCYRVYLERQTVYFIRIEDRTSFPAGSLAVVAEEIRAGNTENYPYVQN